MKSLTATQTKLLSRRRLKPVYLVEISLQGAGAPTLYLSDRNITVGGQIYENYLSDVSGLGDEVRRITSDSLNADITLKFKNSRYKSYNHLIEIGGTYPFEGAVCVIKEVYLDDNNIPSDVLTAFKGALDEPQNIDLMGFECTVSSLPFWMDKAFKQALITKSVYANADPDDLNKVRNIIYGSCQQVRCHAIRAGALDALTAAITATSPGNSGTLVLSDASEFPSSGAFTIQIDAEQIRIASRSGNNLTLASSGARGYGGTTAAAHNQGAGTFEVLSEYVYMVADHPVKQLGDIFVDGVRQTSGVTTYTGQGGNEHASYPGKAIIVFTVKPAIQKQVNIADGIGVSDGIGVADNINFTSAGTMKKIYPNGASGGDNAGAIYDGNENTNSNQYQAGSATYFWSISFPTTNYGSINTQYLWLKVSGSVGSVAWGVSDGSWAPSSIGNNPSGWIRFQRSGGSWGGSINIWSSHGTTTNMYLWEAYLEVDYNPTLNKSGSAYKSGSVTKTGTVTGSGADSVIGESVNCDVYGYQDNGSGTYTGSANALIERPDHVIKHFIDVLYGFSLSDIDSTSFDSAGTSYASAISGGYKLGFVINDEIVPSEFIKTLAGQCRSNINYLAGKWYLKYIPDSAPSPDRTISKSDLAGQHAKFRFNSTPSIDIYNDLVAKFKKNYGKLDFDESDWLGTSIDSDSTSQAKYGIRTKTIEFDAIRIQAMADHVLAFIKLQYKLPLLIVEFPVFWEHFDLDIGDTFDIVNDLYNGKKFYIEKIERISKAKAQITGLEWL
ncbi:MAG: hypothetical protein C4538_10540 [Nitrospiraceae bacterium]|nr:MAG: hypothetical protein C4538_10540 [Nitrospiraceae bacterium]